MDKEICIAGRVGGACTMPMKGMRSEVAIKVAVRNGISYLASSFFTPPLKVADITEDRAAGELHLMLMSASPGVLDGDDLSIRVEVEAFGRLQLHTQSYQRLFQMKEGAVQAVEVTLGKGACFSWLPHPCVPHERAIFTGRNKIFLSEGSQLIWGEVITCGRKLNGEVFRYSKYHVKTEVFIQGQLAILENVCLRPPVFSVEGVGQMEGYTHQASLLYVGSRGVEVLQAEKCLQALEGVIYGRSEGPAGSLVIRILGNKAEPLYDVLKAMGALLSGSKSVGYAG
ncbi:urease accessory protein UreD [Flavitalea sp. BT771]|uniref:urease accessory protein UreD n=1 Tax=Flavitalea sp. BT771 TaxID=3063329 RepID=UPI0026E1A03A|nr:urease accessory protein UreD [Flavitalea sp. BT771]MDO6431912.1 urease accessory protein UreD [Flavitalea sp. BT771]MDV6220821.1 urease accessory protein UreD [Flavitalea sp. BT771]